MAKEKMTEVTLTMRSKWGGRYWPEGKGEVPADALDDLRDAGVLAEPEAETEPQPDTDTDGAAQVKAEAKAATPLTEDEVEAVKIAAAGLSGDDVRKNGAPKVGPLNAALKAGGVELRVTGEQIDALNFGAE